MQLHLSNSVSDGDDEPGAWSKAVSFLQDLSDRSFPCILSRSVFLRLLGLSYAIAFLSLLIQIDGLIGSTGILPATSYLHAISERLGIERYWLAPTLCWIDSSDLFLHCLCIAGAALSIVLIIGWIPVPCLMVLWALYLSLCTVGNRFLSYQWDVLLLETGFLAIFLAPPAIRLSLQSHASPVALWLLRLLLFRFMFSSGVVKIVSGDLNWRHLTALSYHYETQPLPTWAGWYAHQLPFWFHKVSAAGMFVFELMVPFLIFGPRGCRRIAFIVFVGLQSLIAVTGNYCFFNLLTVALCVLLLDDQDWPALCQRVLTERSDHERRTRRWPPQILVPIAACVLLLSSLELIGTLGLTEPWEAPLRWAAPFRTINGYGLFAVMTTSRYEIIVEGSNDGNHWRAYEFKWKPGNLKRRPAFVAPHQPRLDWQMWFAALESYQSNPWFMGFLGRLLEGSPSVLRLLKRNPFPESPPRYIRGIVYDYHFTSFDQRRRTGAWWRRKLLGAYCPTLTLAS